MDVAETKISLALLRNQRSHERIFCDKVEKYIHQIGFPSRLTQVELSVQLKLTTLRICIPLLHPTPQRGFAINGPQPALGISAAPRETLALLKTFVPLPGEHQILPLHGEK
ncbi:MAG TPA: hypothetical protein V6C97_08820 [Oculatellaceae cyanobacterium]